jgi:hypothetical protein
MKFMFSTVYRLNQKDFYAHPYTSIWAPDLRQRIIEAVELTTPHMLINTSQVLEYRLDICWATTGAHTEVYGHAKNLFESLSTPLKT